jgi:hypothetical protein
MRYGVLFGIHEEIKKNRSLTVGTSCQFWIYTHCFVLVRARAGPKGLPRLREPNQALSRTR